MDEEIGRGDGMSLSQSQRWFANIVVRPLTSGDHMQIVGEDGRELAEIDSIIAPNAKLSAFERLEVYNRQYWFRLLEALHTDFPALLKLVGKKRFRTLAEAYLTDCPSTSYTLRDLGSRLPQWLATNSQYGGRYPEAAIDLARLEWAYVEAFDAPGLAPANPDQVSALGENARLRLQPHIRRVELRCPVDEFAARAHAQEFARRKQAQRGSGNHRFRPLPGSFTVAVYRSNDQVMQQPLDPEAVTLLKAVADGKPLGEALEIAFLESTIAPQEIAARVQRWFAEWYGRQWFTIAGG